MNERFTAPETSVDPNAPTVPELHSFGEHRVTAGLVLGGRHPLTLCGLSQVLGQEEGFTVLAVATTQRGDTRRSSSTPATCRDSQPGSERDVQIIAASPAPRCVARIVVLTPASEYTKAYDTDTRPGPFLSGTGAARAGLRAAVARRSHAGDS